MGHDPGKRAHLLDVFFKLKICSIVVDVSRGEAKATVLNSGALTAAGRRLGGFDGGRSDGTGTGTTGVGRLEFGVLFHLVHVDQEPRDGHGADGFLEEQRLDGGGTDRP